MCSHIEDFLALPEPPATTVTPSAGVQALGDNTFTIDGNTYSFEDVAQLLVRLQLVPALKDSVHLASAGQATGNVDPAKHVVEFVVGGSVVNTQPSDTPLPLSQVEAESP